MSAKNYEQTAKIQTDVMLLSSQTKIMKAQMQYLKALRFLHSKETIEEINLRKFKFAQLMETHSYMSSIFNESFDDIYDEIDVEDEKLDEKINSIIQEALGSKNAAYISTKVPINII